MTRECTPGLFGIKRAHRFVGCYDKSQPVDLMDNLAWWYPSKVTIPQDALVKKVIYICHVCIRCGERIERNKP